MKSFPLLLAAAVVVMAFATTADAAQKRKRAKAPAAVPSYVGPPKTYRNEPARMIEIAPGRWISTWGCYTDEGNGRYGSCDMREGPM
jgi:hypothetical protein